jgi:hypothetical protein
LTFSVSEASAFALISCKVTKNIPHNRWKNQKTPSNTPKYPETRTSKPETNKKNAISTHQRAPMALNEVAIIPAVTKRAEV